MIEFNSEIEANRWIVTENRFINSSEYRVNLRRK